MLVGGWKECLADLQEGMRAARQCAAAHAMHLHVEVAQDALLRLVVRLIVKVPDEGRLAITALANHEDNERALHSTPIQEYVFAIIIIRLRISLSFLRCF